MVYELNSVVIYGVLLLMLLHMIVVDCVVVAVNDEFAGLDKGLVSMIINYIFNIAWLV